MALPYPIFVSPFQGLIPHTLKSSNPLTLNSHPRNPLAETQGFAKELFIAFDWLRHRGQSLLSVVCCPLSLETPLKNLFPFLVIWRWQKFSVRNSCKDINKFFLVLVFTYVLFLEFWFYATRCDVGNLTFQGLLCCLAEGYMPTVFSYCFFVCIDDNQMHCRM